MNKLFKSIKTLSKFSFCTQLNRNPEILFMLNNENHWMNEKIKNESRKIKNFSICI